MNKSIYELSAEVKQLEEDLLNSVDEETGEIDEEISKALDVTREEFDGKAVSLIKLSDKFNADVSVIDSEIARLTALKKSYKKSADRLKNGVTNAMRTLGIDEIRTSTMRLSFRKSEETVIDNLVFVPEEYLKIKWEPDKTAIKKAIKDGKEVQGAHLEIKYNLQVR